MLKTATRFTLNQWRHFIEALFWLPIVDVRLKRHGFDATRRWMQAKTASLPATHFHRGKESFSDEVALAVNVAARRTFWPTTCLRQALVLQFFLARVGIQSDLKLGVRKDDHDALAAHAWVEREGRVLIGGERAPETHVTLV